MNVMNINVLEWAPVYLPEIDKTVCLGKVLNRK
jgi:hypothetical protein